jgi:ATPase family AAA domain-containing protein 3A/B
MRWSAAPRCDRRPHPARREPPPRPPRHTRRQPRPITHAAAAHCCTRPSSPAQALREIQASPHAKRVFEQVKAEEATKQAEAKAKEAEFKAAGEKAAVEHERVRWEEQRKAMQQDAQTKAQLAQYQDELARKRAEAEHEKQRARNAELVALQEESGRRQEEQRAAVAAQIEAERRATERYKSDLEKGVQRERALAEAEGRTAERRANEDIARRELALKLEEDRKRLVEGINSVFANLGTAAGQLLSDRDKMLTAVGGLSLLALGVYGAREGTRAAGKTFDRWFGTPRLVRETSRRPLVGRGGAPPEKSADAVRRDFGDIVLAPALQEHVRALAAVTANTKRHAAPFRHMLFYGPPGTGKTLAAKRMARTSGLDYAIMSGGDVAPLGGGAVTQLHDMFDWAERSNKGLLLFIDEADAFLGRRSGGMSEGLRGALNALLFRTGDQSREFCVVIATNRPADLDPAVIDRMDEALEFALPGPQERKRILDIYFEKYIVRAGAEGEAGAGPRRGLLRRAADLFRRRGGASDAIGVRGVDEAALWAAAEATEGFSGRELAKLMASVQAAAYGSHEAVLTQPMFQRVLDLKVEEHRQRALFAQGPQD